MGLRLQTVHTCSTSSPGKRYGKELKMPSERAEKKSAVVVVVNTTASNATFLDVDAAAEGEEEEEEATAAEAAASFPLRFSTANERTNGGEERGPRRRTLSLSLSLPPPLSRRFLPFLILSMIGKLGMRRRRRREEKGETWVSFGSTVTRSKDAFCGPHILASKLKISHAVCELEKKYSLSAEIHLCDARPGRAGIPRESLEANAKSSLQQ